ncbi:hypothetical protein [Chitiniphilus eburneus]|nr:hypothetical protein [Chitiniphilus eburneus]
MLDRLTVANSTTWGNASISYDSSGNLTNCADGLSYQYVAAGNLC